MQKMTMPLLVSLGLALMVAAVPSAAQAGEMTGQKIEAEVYHSIVESPLGVSRSWYGSSFVFYTSYETGSYYFDGNNVGIEMTCSSNHAGTFSVSLFREEGDQIVGTATLNRIGFSGATWSNVGPGRYYFKFKQSGSSFISSSDVAMFSW